MEFDEFEERVDDIHELNVRALDVEISDSIFCLQRPNMIFRKVKDETKSRTCQTLSGVGGIHKDWRVNTIWYAAVYESDSGGVYKSANAGSTWTYSAFANPIYCVRSDGEDTVIAGGVDSSNDECFHYSTNGGTGWTSITISNGNIRDIAIRPDGQDTLLAADLGGGVRRATGHGFNSGYWSVIGLSGSDVYQVRYCPGQSNIALAGTGSGIYKCEDVNASTPTWSAANYGGSTDTVIALDFHATENSIVLMSNRSGTTGDVFISADTARSWIELDDGLSDEIVYDFAFDDDAPYKFYTATDEGVYEMRVPVYSDTLNIDDNLTIGPGTAIINGDVTISAGDTLTVAAGTKVYVVYDFDVQRTGYYNDRAEINVDGVLICNGTSSDSVIFTSSKPSPEKGDWVGIKVDTNAVCSLQFTAIRYADYGIFALDSADIDLNNCEISNCDVDAIYASKALISVDSSNINTNDGRGTYLLNPNR